MALEYQARFMKQSQLAELSNLWHLSATACAGGDRSRHARMIWAARAFANAHPEVSNNGAYKDLDGMLT